jgi:asparagine synthase (glutamine-hydrolysing)
MHHSLEVRVPLLDKEVLDYATRLYWSECINLKECIGKIPLRNLLKRHTQFQAMKKRGFTVPIGQWLKGHFKETFRGAVIDKCEILGTPINRKNIANAYQDLSNGKQEMAWPLWSLLMLSMWEEKHLKAPRHMPGTLI